MQFQASLHGYGLLLAAMAILAIVETWLPFSRKREWRRRHLPSNLALAALTLGLNLAFNAGAVLITLWLTARGFGALAGASLPPLAMTAIGFVVLDAATYACHRSMHWLPPLWRVHRVHHSDPLVDVTTTLRQHPIEGLWRFLFIMAPAWALGVPAPVVAAYRVVSALVGATEHMDVKLWEPLDRVLSRFVCTPNMHKLHHSRRTLETDSNYGNLFALFDRVFGTFMPPTRGRCVDHGLDGYDGAEAQQLGALLRLPFQRSDRILSSAADGKEPATSPLRGTPAFRRRRARAGSRR